MATTIAMAISDLSPPTTAWPMAFISPASSRPWLAIHRLCQPSITTATVRIAALNTSCPRPASESDSTPAKPASSAPPTTPAPTPAAMKMPRRGTPRVAASTMPTIKPASNTSRNTMIRLANIALILRLALDGGHRAFCRIRMIIVEEFVNAGPQRPRHDRDLPARDDDLLHAQVGALEFSGCRILVLDLDPESLAGGHAHLARHEEMVLDGQRHGFRRRRGHRSRQQGANGRQHRHDHMRQGPGRRSSGRVADPHHQPLDKPGNVDNNKTARQRRGCAAAADDCFTAQESTDQDLAEQDLAEQEPTDRELTDREQMADPNALDLIRIPSDVLVALDWRPYHFALQPYHYLVRLAHVVSMAAFFGGIAALDLRLMGWRATLPLQLFADLVL